MPLNTDPNGLTRYIPGVYSRIKVVSSLPGALPDFQIPVLLGAAVEGHPYNADSLKYSHETAFSPFEFVGSASAAAEYFGAESEVVTVLKWAKRQGLPGAWVSCLGALTRATVIATSAGPVSQMTVYPRKFGTPGGYIKIKCTGGTALEITPVKRWSMLASNGASGATRIYVTDNSWVTDGMTLTIGSNAQAATTKVVGSHGTEINATGQTAYWIELTVALAANFTTAAYALICIYDTTAVESSGTLATVQAAYDWLNNSSRLLGAKQEATFNGAVAALTAVATATAIKDLSTWSTNAGGASPAPTSSDFDDFITAMEATEWDAFLLRESVKPRLFYIADPSSTVHGAFRDWAVQKRSEGSPIAVVTGCDWADIAVDAANDTDPTFRAAALDSQDVQLVAGGIDRLAAYLSHGPQVWGIRARMPVNHNLTNDRLFYSELEVQWDERGSGDLTTLHKDGVSTYRLGDVPPYRFVVSQGLNTLQDNDNAWNVGTADTCLTMQRDNADYVDRTVKDGLMGQQLGADGVNPTSIAATIIKRGDALLKRGYITQQITISSITLNDSGSGYDVVWSFKQDPTIDFINSTAEVLIGD